MVRKLYKILQEAQLMLTTGSTRL